MTPTVTSDQIMGALGDFLTAILPLTPKGTTMVPTPVIQGQINRVVQPGTDYFVAMVENSRTTLSTNVAVYDGKNNLIGYAKPTQIAVQIDIHGPAGNDNAQVIATLWRSDYACRLIDATIFQPLFATDGQQTPFINGENQYEARWTMSLNLQVNATISTPAQFADKVVPDISAPVGA